GPAAAVREGRGLLLPHLQRPPGDPRREAQLPRQPGTLPGDRADGRLLRVGPRREREAQAAVLHRPGRRLTAVHGRARVVVEGTGRPRGPGHERRRRLPAVRHDHHTGGARGPRRDPRPYTGDAEERDDRRLARLRHRWWPRSHVLDPRWL